MRFNHFLTSLPGFLLIIFLFQGCGPGAPGTWQNDQIKAGKREEMHRLNTILFNGLKANAADKLEHIMSKELIDNHYRFREIELISNRMKTDSFTLANEYYIVNKHRGRQVVKITDKGINNCEVGFDAQNKEMYIAMFTAKTAWSQWMITAVYNKLDYGWKLNELEMNPYTINGKTAPELYNEAKESYKKGYIVDAVNTMAMVADCAHPNDGWEYNSLKDLNSFYTGLVDEANVKYKFPLTLSAVGTKPRIFRIFNQAMPDGTFPMVYYISRINVKDTVAIRKENNAIKSTIDKTIPGLANNKKYVLYSAFNELPNSRRESDHYNMR